MFSVFLAQAAPRYRCLLIVCSKILESNWWVYFPSKAKSGQQTTDWGSKQRNGIKARQIYRDLTNKKIEAMRIEIRDKLYHGTRALLLTQMKVEPNVATENNHGKTQSNYNWVQASQFSSIVHNFPMLHSKSLKASSPNPQNVSRKSRPLTSHLALAVPEWRIRATRQSSWAVGPGVDPTPFNGHLEDTPSGHMPRQDLDLI